MISKDQWLREAILYKQKKQVRLNVRNFQKRLEAYKKNIKNKLILFG